jgi:hypothetical protein
MHDDPLYLGRFQQGQDIPLVCQCTDADGVPADPASAPVATVYQSGSDVTLIETRTLAALDRGVVAGMFSLGLFLGSLYSNPGRYLVVYRWADQDGVGHSVPCSFVLLPGGSATGAVVSMTSVRRPDSHYLLYQTDAGQLLRGRNPR